MILTLTANPSTDRTVSLSGPLLRGAVQRVESETSQAGGKGINISRAATIAGVPTIAVLPAEPDDPFVHSLRRDGIDARPQLPSGPIRVNLTITEPDGTTTKLNSPGPTASTGSLCALADALVARAEQASWIVLAGSLPPGAPAAWYSDLVSKLRGSSARVAVDTSGEPLRALADALPDAAPDLIKPNGEELASISGVDGTGADLEADPERAASAAQRLVKSRVGAVLCTLGGNGAVLVTADGAWHAIPPPVDVVSTVGAGDCSLFGYLYADQESEDPAGRLARAVAYGSAAASLPGTTIPHPDQARPDLVAVRRLS